MAEHYDLQSCEVSLILDAATLTSKNRREFLRLAGLMMQAEPLSGLVEFNVKEGKITKAHYSLSGDSLTHMAKKGG